MVDCAFNLSRFLKELGFPVSGDAPWDLYNSTVVPARFTVFLKLCLDSVSLRVVENLTLTQTNSLPISDERNRKWKGYAIYVVGAYVNVAGGLFPFATSYFIACFFLLLSPPQTLDCQSSGYVVQKIALALYSCTSLRPVTSNFPR